MKKVFYLVPLLMLLMVMGIEATLDVSWNCPISGTSETTTLYKYLTYQDQIPYADCQKGGNNLTIEFRLTGDASDFKNKTDTAVFDATLYIYKGGDVKFTLPLSNSFTNTSATQTDLVRFTDFGELYTTGLNGLPRWVNNLTYSDYKYYIQIRNTTSDGTMGNILTSEPGMYSGDMVKVIFKHPQSKGAYVAEAAMAGVPGTEEVQAMLGVGPAAAGKGAAKDLIPVIVVIIIVALLFFSKKKTK